LSHSGVSAALSPLGLGEATAAPGGHLLTTPHWTLKPAPPVAKGLSVCLCVWPGFLSVVPNPARSAHPRPQSLH
jgi:hypothetical protein